MEEFDELMKRFALMMWAFEDADRHADVLEKKREAAKEFEAIRDALFDPKALGRPQDGSLRFRYLAIVMEKVHGLLGLHRYLG